MIQGKPFSPYRAFTGIFIPDSLIPYRGISAAEKICLGRLYKYCGKTDECWPSQEELAEELGADIRTVGRYIEALANDGFIEIEQRGMGRSNLYRILGHPVFGAEPNQTGQPCPVRPDNLVRSDQTTLSGPSIELKRIIKEENQENNTNSFSEERTTPETLIRLWGSTKGLKRLSPAERKHVLENWKWFEVSEEVLTEALIRFAQWYKTSTNHLRSPVALFMKDPASWATLRTVPKDNRWDSRLVHFRGLYESTGAPSIDDDWDQAMKFCGELTEEDWQKAFAQVVTVQGAYQKAPKNYFRTREFERAPRPAPKSKLEEMWDKI